MKDVYYKIFFSALMATCVAWSAVTFGQDAEATAEPPADTVKVQVLYGDYAKAQYAVRIDLSQSTTETLSKRLGRFWYYLLYTNETLLNRTQAPQVQLGFFASLEEARQFADEYSGLLPGLQVVRVSEQEHRTLFAMLETTPQQDRRYYWISPDSEATQASMTALLEQAKNHYMNGQYVQAIYKYRVLSLSGDQNISLWARELMALSYERLGRKDLAIEIYRSLLSEDADYSGTTRVQQRLRALETAADDGHDARRPSKYAQQKEDRTYFRGVFGQAYRYMQREDDYFGDFAVLSAATTNFDLYAGTQSEHHKLDFRTQGYHLYDIREDGDDTELRLKRLHLDYTHRSSGFGVTGGRQKDFRAGTYTSFDGITVRYPVTEDVTVAASYGQPITFSDAYDDLDHEFFSVQASWEPSERWQLSGYAIGQTLYGETDRMAWGGEAKYRDDPFSAYINFDYDYEFAELNNLLAGGTYRISTDSYVSARYGRQRSPFLTATNILLGQPQLDVEAYLQTEYNREYLLYGALQRTSLSEYGTVTYSKTIDENLQFTLDLYQSYLKDMPIYGNELNAGELEIVGKGAEYRYSSFGAQMVARGFIGENDSANFSVRFADSSANKYTLLQVSDKFRFGSAFSLTPKVQFSYTQKKINDDSQSRIRGALETSYRLWRSTQLYLEGGAERFEDLAEKYEITSYFLRAGYQARF